MVEASTRPGHDVLVGVLRTESRPDGTLAEHEQAAIRAIIGAWNERAKPYGRP
jgi:hypothetical protein